MGKYFGTDGIRGLASYLLASNFSYRLGFSIGKILKPQQVVIGMDTRESGSKILTQLKNGLLKHGVEVLFAPDATTPMISYYSKEKNIVGIMITASHNPYHDNGIKIFDGGYKTKPEIEALIEESMDGIILDDLKDTGSFRETNDVLHTYLQFYKNLDFPKTNLKVAYDCAHGASYKVASKVFELFTDKATGYNCEPDGTNINKDCGSTHLAFLQNIMKNDDYDIGFAFDGDADRCLVVGPGGTIVDGDQILYLFAHHLHKQNKLEKHHVVMTKMSNPGILKALTDDEITYSLTDVGDKHVFKEMDDYGYKLGGEASGHIILRDFLHTGDGILVAIFMMQVLKETKLEEALKHIELYPHKMINIQNIDKNVLNSPVVIEAIEECKRVFGEDYLVLIRPSGTEPLLRVTMSYKDEVVLDEQINKMIDIIKKEGSII